MSGQSPSERRLRLVAMLSLVVLAIEIAAGFWTRSFALVAEGFHMFAHVGAFSVAAAAFWYARTRKASGKSFVFGDGKVHALAAFSNGALLIAVALLTVVGSIEALLEPQAIRFAQAISVAGLGLVFNIVSILVVGRRGHAHDHDHDHDLTDDHSHDHAHDDNLRAAYLHLLGDALSGVGTIGALLGGRFLGWRFADPVVALITSAVVARWGFTLCGSVARYLIDQRLDERGQTVLAALQAEGLPVGDLQLWEVAANQLAAIATITAPTDEAGGLANEVEQRLRATLPLVSVGFRFAPIPSKWLLKL